MQFHRKPFLQATDRHVELAGLDGPMTVLVEEGEVVGTDGFVRDGVNGGDNGAGRSA